MVIGKSNSKGLFFYKKEPFLKKFGPFLKKHPMFFSRLTSKKSRFWAAFQGYSTLLVQMYEFVLRTPNVN